MEKVDEVAANVIYEHGTTRKERKVIRKDKDKEIGNYELTEKANFLLNEIVQRIPGGEKVRPSGQRSDSKSFFKEFDEFVAYCEWYLGIFKVFQK